MKLLERSEHMDQLRSAFQEVIAGRGRSVFIAGEAGIGKTALVRQFISEIDTPYLLLEGYSDSLFAARPLGPLFDIAPLLGDDFVRLLKENPSRNLIFPAALEALNSQGAPVILFFEDIHWADEATLDFIRFLARRIKQIQCLFILTLRDTELPSGHPYRMILGELPPTDYQKIILPPLTPGTVQTLAEEAGREGSEVYQLTGGIPYFVREILASYHLGIPETVRDSILSLYHRQFDATKDLWEMVSVIPGRIDMEVVRIMHPTFSKVVEFCFNARILIHETNAISFKHELFRTTIEESLSPVRRQELHKLVTDAMLIVTGIEVPTARIIHHARLAKDTQRLRELAPKAAAEAALLGSHLEAAKFYKLALEHQEHSAPEHIADLYEDYSYECYLTNQIPEAIEALEHAVQYWKDDNSLRKGNAFRFPSRLYWFAGEMEPAEHFGLKAVDLCAQTPDSRELALAYSNMSQLMMLGDNSIECLRWGEKAIALAVALDDTEVLCHSLNNIGTMLLCVPERITEGEEKLRESLRLALDHEYHEHAARAYTNLASACVEMRRYDAAETLFDEGIAYCDARDLHSWMYYLQSSQAALFLETGRWDEAETLCNKLLKNHQQQIHVKITLRSILATICIRRGTTAEQYLQPALADVIRIGEVHRLVPVTKVLLEDAWMRGTEPTDMPVVRLCIARLLKAKNPWLYPDIAFWSWKSMDMLPEELNGINGRNDQDRREIALRCLDRIRQGNPYLEALWLSEGDDEHQREALVQLKTLGAQRTAERVEAQMRSQGIRHIPRGPRASTAKNAAGLTRRQMDVLGLIAEGMQNKEIAGQLFLSAKTIDHHISAILTKLDVRSRSKAVARAKELGILK